LKRNNKSSFGCFYERCTIFNPQLAFNIIIYGLNKTDEINTRRNIFELFSWLKTYIYLYQHLLFDSVGELSEALTSAIKFIWYNTHVLSQQKKIINTTKFIIMIFNNELGLREWKQIKTIN